MYSTRNFSSARSRQLFLAGLAAVALVAGLAFQAGSSSAADGAGTATLTLAKRDGKVMVTVGGLPANASVTIKGTVGKLTGQRTFKKASSENLVVALAPKPGSTGQLTVTATSGATKVTKAISLTAGQNPATAGTAEEQTDGSASGAKTKTKTATATEHADGEGHETGSKDAPKASSGAKASGGGTECEKFAGGDSHDICQGPMDGEAGEIQAYVAELIALLKDEAGMKAAGLFLDPGSSNHYQVYASKYKKEWPSGARVAHLVEDDGKIKGAQIDTSGNSDWMKKVPNSGSDSGHSHMDGKGGYWHDPH